MIKTIILDESKVNAFLKDLEPNPRVCMALAEKQKLSQRPIDVLKDFLEATKIEPQTNKQNSLTPYEVNR